MALTALLGLSLISLEAAPPVIAPVEPQEIDEEIAWFLELVGSDPDLGQQLTWSLVSGPENAAVDPRTGLLSWTPSEAQGPGSYAFQVRLSDDGVPPGSADAEFTVSVREINRAPWFPPPGPIAPLFPHEQLNIWLQASDPDIPSTELTWSLDPESPAWAVIQPFSGLLSLQPTHADAGRQVELGIRVTDGGVPPLSAGIVLPINVVGPGAVPYELNLSDGSLAIGGAVAPGSVVTTYGSTNLIDWTFLGASIAYDGQVSFSVPVEVETSASYVRIELQAQPPAQSYRGGGFLVTGTAPPGLGSDAIVRFDLNQDNVYEFEVLTKPDGSYAVMLDTREAPDLGRIAYYFSSGDGSIATPPVLHTVARDPDPNPAEVVPVNRSIIDGQPVEPSICTCTECEESSALSLFNQSYTPSLQGIQLVDGKQRLEFPLLAFPTAKHGFAFNLVHATLVDYDGPFGQGVSSGFNTLIVRHSETTGQLVTADLRVFNLGSEDGVNWQLPDGFFSRLVLDEPRRCWVLTHFSGRKIEFYLAPEGLPGRPLAMSDPHGNTTRLVYDPSGLLGKVITDLGQEVTFAYDERTSRLASVTDQLNRTWEILHNETGALVSIATPVIEQLTVAPGELITETEIPERTIHAARLTQIFYDDPIRPSFPTRIVDGRGAEIRRADFDELGRVATLYLNGHPLSFNYAPAAGPTPLPALETGNVVTRVTDREGNLTDHEIHGPGRLGAYGQRREVSWTASGRGNPALRPNEPLFYERRWFHDCNCLVPGVITEAWASTDLPQLDFQPNGIPRNWPRRERQFNEYRQILNETVTDGTDQLRREYTYQPGAFGDGGEFSLRLSETGPRAFSGSPLDAGLSFVTAHQYDAAGNRIRTVHPTITRGVQEPQPVTESWTYNGRGQPLSHTDPNGNVIRWEFHAGPATGGDINTRGSFPGYPAAEIRGATGSADGELNLTTRYRVNALGQPTQIEDPLGRVLDIYYNVLGDPAETRQPEVTLPNGTTVRYRSFTHYDAAGFAVAMQQENLDLHGIPAPNRWITITHAHDAAGNLLAERRELSNDPAADLITRWAYNRNDQPIVLRLPEGNRSFTTFDERKLPFQTFTGVSPANDLLEGYPDDPAATSLPGHTFVSRTRQDYDARGNPNVSADGRGNLRRQSHDFLNRLVAARDANGHGSRREYDAASNRITEAAGRFDELGTLLVEVLKRDYARHDELDRPFRIVADGDLTTAESDLVDPSSAENPSWFTERDAGGRRVGQQDANGQLTTYGYDAANRQTDSRDPLGNTTSTIFDPAGNPLSWEETELPGPGATGDPETHVTTAEYDELNRRVALHQRGLNGNSLDQVTRFAFDARGNVGLVTDPEGRYVLSLYDDQNRLIRTRQFDGDPVLPATAELRRTEHGYDRNGNKTADVALADLADAHSAQVTRYAYDYADRQVRVVYPDSDDPIDGSSNGADGLFDRVEIQLDPNANPVVVTDQRGVVFSNTFDPANRLVRQDLNLVGTTAAPGSANRVQFAYDPLNRPTHAANNFTLVERAYDDLSRLRSETQSIRLDGSGELSFVQIGDVLTINGNYEEPVELRHAYDAQANPIGCEILAGATTDLAVSRGFDALNRARQISGAYFNRPSQPIAGYAYFGPGRLQTKTLGNGAVLRLTYDVKRRPATHVWRSDTNGGNLLVGFEYTDPQGSGYTATDNVLYERFLHDNSAFDHFTYNTRDELTGVAYRSPSSAPPPPDNLFAYDANYNRTSATFGDPFNAAAQTVDSSYAISPANEYTQITRDNTVFQPEHDRAGNMTRILTRPVTGEPEDPDVLADARWDGFNRLFDVDTGTVNGMQHYRYDVFGRRVVVLDSLTILQDSRRFVYDDWSVVAERLFEPGATLASAPSRLERIYIEGPRIDEHLLAAIDRDGDGFLGGENLLNARDISADQEYYHLANRLGSTMALLDAANPARVLEYYRYSVHGEAVVLASVDNNGDGLEDTPLDLSDNLPADPRRFSEEFGNPRLFAGRDFDEQTGQQWFRHRLYEARSGRFVTRDPRGPWSDPFARGNNYTYAANRPTVFVDPLGLTPTRGEECCNEYRDFWQVAGYGSHGACWRACMSEMAGEVMGIGTFVAGAVGTILRGVGAATAPAAGAAPGAAPVVTVPGAAAAGSFLSAVAAGAALGTAAGCAIHCEKDWCYRPGRWLPVGEVLENLDAYAEVLDRKTICRLEYLDSAASIQWICAEFKR
ncbi:MAG: hypothetical protein KJ072_08035 [Verrucomicrobia bacterium]|nr:hypothetical protein [Verrucomicrobiota bacterium]